MLSDCFVKFHYKTQIKKTKISPDNFNIEYINKFLSDSFKIPTNRIHLSYEGSNGYVSVTSNEDLIGARGFTPGSDAMNLYVSKNPRKAEHNSLESSTQVNLTSELHENKCDFEKSLQVQEHSGEDGKLESKIIHVDTQELKSVLEEILFTKEAQEKIYKLKSKCNIDRSLKTDDKEFLMDVDKNLLADYVISIFNKILNEPEPIERDPEANLQKKDVELCSSQNNLFESIVFKKEKAPMEEEMKVEKLKREPLEQSIYGNMQLDPKNYNKPEELKDLKEKSFLDKSFTLCKDLTSTYGVKLEMRYENGKMRLMSIPALEYSIIDSIPKDSL